MFWGRGPTSLCDSLLNFGIFWSPQTLREEIVNYLISVESVNGEVFRDFSNILWDDYVEQMDMEGTYGNKLTLRAFGKIFSVEIETISTLGNDRWVSINPENSNLLGWSWPLRVPSKRDCRGWWDPTTRFRRHSRQYCWR